MANLVLHCQKHGKMYHDVDWPGHKPLYQFESLADAGFIWIQTIGEENVYFVFTTDHGVLEEGYCKCL